MPPVYDQKQWRRKHDNPATPVVQTPMRRYYPDTPSSNNPLYDDTRDLVVNDLVEIVIAAEAAPNPRPEVRACGSHWALSHAAVTHPVAGFAVETHDPDGNLANPSRPRMNLPLYGVVPACLSAEAWRFFIGQNPVTFDPINPPDESKIYLFHVQAGMRIWELYSLLDQGDDNEPRSLAAALPKYKGPWAMATLGGAGGQTIVGAISTGTHGGDVHRPPIADAVQALHLIGPDGQQYWIERPLPDGSWLVDDEKLRDKYPGIEILRQADELAAVLVAVGRMGIIYSVVLRVIRQYALDQTNVKSDWSTVRIWLNNPSAPIFTNNRFVQVLLNPNPQPLSAIEKLLSPFLPPVEEHTCYVQTRVMKGLNAAGQPPQPPYGRAERSGPNGGKTIPVNGGHFLDTLCASESAIIGLIDGLIGESVKAIGDILDAVLPFPIPEDIVEFALDVLDTLAEAVGLLIELLLLNVESLSLLLELIKTSVFEDESLATGGGTAAVIANWCAEHQHMELFRRIAELLFDLSQPPPSLTAISYAMMDIHNYAPDAFEDPADARRCKPWGDSLEVFFDAGSVALITFVDLLLQRVRELGDGWLTGQRMAFGGYVSMRFTRSSMGLLAMQKSPVTCSLEIAAPGAVKGTEPFLARVEADAIALGGRVHWGQRNNLTLADVENMYDPQGPAGFLFRWRDVLSRLSANGRLAAFSTQFTRDRGLEVVQPKIKAFSVSPVVTCGNSTVHVVWDAEDNPPGTVARLEVRKVSFVGPPQAVVGLDSLSGGRDVPVPPGRYDIVLLVSYTLNGRTITDQDTRTVLAIEDHDVVPAPSQFATCRPIDGVWRWAVEVVFDSSYSPQLLVEELTCEFVGASLWNARLEGGTVNVAFTPTSKVQPLPSHPKLQGTWTFFVDAPGCSGSAPLFTASFKLTCGL